MIRKTLQEFFEEYSADCEVKINLIYCSECGKDIVIIISRNDIMYRKFKEDACTLKSVTYDGSYDRYLIDLNIVQEEE